MGVSLARFLAGRTDRILLSRRDERDQRPPAAAERRAAPPSLPGARRDDRRPVALAARSWLSAGQGRGGARLSAGRERLLPGGDAAAPGADRPIIRGDEGADQGGRKL